GSAPDGAEPFDEVFRPDYFATVTSTLCTPGAVGLTVEVPLPELDRARIFQSPGAAKKRKSPVAEATTSAVNSSVPSSRRTKAPPTGSPSAFRTRPVMTVSFSVSTPAGRVWVWTGAPHMIS